MHVKWFTTLETRKELELKYVPKLFLGSIREGAGGGGGRRSAIGQLFLPSLVTVPEVFAKVNLVRTHHQLLTWTSFLRF